MTFNYAQLASAYCTWKKCYLQIFTVNCPTHTTVRLTTSNKLLMAIVFENCIEGGNERNVFSKEFFVGSGGIEM